VRLLRRLPGCSMVTAMTGGAAMAGLAGAEGTLVEFASASRQVLLRHGGENQRLHECVSEESARDGDAGFTR
jgi:hypothetical protein